METKTHYKRLQHPDYLGAYALEPGQELILTIREVKNEIVTGSDGKKDECVVAYFKEEGIKPMIMNSTNLKTIHKVYKTPYIEEWSGKQIQVYSTPVKAFGEMHEALRIRPMVPKQSKPKIADIDKAKAAIKEGKITLEQVLQKYDVTPEQEKELTNA
jgi:hypothetical protein